MVFIHAICPCFDLITLHFSSNNSQYASGILVLPRSYLWNVLDEIWSRLPASSVDNLKDFLRSFICFGVGELSIFPSICSPFVWIFSIAKTTSCRQIYFQWVFEIAKYI